jgi:hypothetical protein
LVLVLAAVCCSVIVAWSSARFRHPLLILLIAGAILGSMVVLQDNEMTLFCRGEETPLFNGISWLLNMLPVNTLIHTYFLAEQVTMASKLAFLLAFPLALSTLLCWLAGRAFLRRRKV